MLVSGVSCRHLSESQLCARVALKSQQLNIGLQSTHQGSIEDALPLPMFLLCQRI